MWAPGLQCRYRPPPYGTSVPYYGRSLLEIVRKHYEKAKFLEIPRSSYSDTGNCRTNKSKRRKRYNIDTLDRKLRELFMKIARSDALQTGVSSLYCETVK